MENKSWKGWLYLLPAFLFLGLFMVYPLVDVLIYSFEEGFNFAAQSGEGVGLYNYSFVLHDPFFLQAVKNTFILVAITVPLSTLLALAISPAPDRLVLDAPVSGVDQNGLKMFLDTVMRLKEQHHMAILLVSHDLNLVRQYADHVVLLDKTVQVQGPPDMVYASPEFQKAFGVGARNLTSTRHHGVERWMPRVSPENQEGGDA